MYAAFYMTEFAVHIACVRLLSLVLLEFLLDLALYGIEVESCRRLHRRKLYRRFGELGHFLLDQNKAPELAGEEIHGVTGGGVVKSFPAKFRRSLERILADIDDRGHIRRDLFSGPAVGLLEKHEFEIVETQSSEMRAAKVPELMARRRPFAQKEIELIVAVQMIFVAPVTQLHAFEQLFGDIGIASRSSKRR